MSLLSVGFTRPSVDPMAINPPVTMPHTSPRKHNPAPTHEAMRGKYSLDISRASDAAKSIDSAQL